MTRVATTLILFLALLVGGILLQIFLSKRKSKWPGLILPAVTFLWSLVLVLNAAAFDSLAQAAATVLMVFILGNIPTAVLLGIYFACREKRRKRSELDKMKLSDL